MEGLCDMFSEANMEESETNANFAEDNKYKFIEVNFQVGDLGNISIYEMDGKEESVLIGQALWKGSKILSQWMASHQNSEGIFKGKRVLELGSGPGLCGFVAAKLGAQQVVFTDYKRQVMELIAHNIRNYRESSGMEVQQQLEQQPAQDEQQEQPELQEAEVQQQLFHSQLDWYYANQEGYLETLEVLDEKMSQVRAVEPLEGAQGSQSAPEYFMSLAEDFDYIIGSDLLYFPESIQPLFKMLEKLFQINKKPEQLTFYMCMMQRGKEIHQQLEQCIEESPLTAELIDVEEIGQLAKSTGQKAFLYKITAKQIKNQKEEQEIQQQEEEKQSNNLPYEKEQELNQENYAKGQQEKIILQ